MSEKKNESGRPGGGQGRSDEVGGSGVHPASAGKAPEGAELRNQAGWGQGERGPAGYDDSGSSELHFTEEQLRAAERGETVNLDTEKDEGSPAATRRPGGSPNE